MKLDQYTTNIAPGAHWSLVVRKGVQMTLTDVKGGVNVGALFFNPTSLSEKYNAPDTLKCQHTFKLTRGHCLYSDMGRIFCSITEDSFGWHETMCGNSHANHIEERWGARSYQDERNEWKQNGYDAFLVEIAKYDLTKRAMASNVNFFSQVSADKDGILTLSKKSSAGNKVTLRFEMDTLVVLHTCPHPLDHSENYPARTVQIDLSKAAPVTDDDYCLNFRKENERGFKNNALYHLGL